MIYTTTLFKKILGSILLFVGCGYLTAQQIGQDDQDKETPSAEGILQSMDIITSEQKIQPRRSNTASDIAYISQIGSDNFNFSRVSAQSSKLNHVQHGNSNQARIHVTAKNLVHNSLQNGNGNIILEYGNASHLNLNRTILQQGDNQNLMIYGSNSLTDDLRVQIQGDAEALTIRNFN